MSTIPICACGVSFVGGWRATESDYAGRGPEPGELVICPRCARLYQFDADLQVETLAPDALDRFTDEARVKIRRAQERIVTRNRIPS
jgi:hypothetical protein